ncbi:hypothetical protein [Ferruginibacter sp.]
MDTSSRITNVYSRIWLIAALINAIICSLILILEMQLAPGGFVLFFFLAFVFSLVLSVPIQIAAMLFSIFILSTGRWQNIFQVVLVVTFFVSIAGAWGYNGFLSFVDRNNIPLCVSIVVSTVSSVIINRTKLNAPFTDKEQTI